MKTGIFLLGTLIVTCSVTLVSGKKPNPLPANGPQDYGCEVIAVNTHSHILFLKLDRR